MKLCMQIRICACVRAYQGAAQTHRWRRLRSAANVVRLLAGEWNTVTGPQGCLTAADRNVVEFSECAEGNTAQHWRLVAVDGVSDWNAMESMRFPGMCAVRAASGDAVPACSCAEIALKVRRTSPRMHGLCVVQHRVWRILAPARVAESTGDRPGEDIRECCMHACCGSGCAASSCCAGGR